MHILRRHWLDYDPVALAAAADTTGPAGIRPLTAAKTAGRCKTVSASRTAATKQKIRLLRCPASLVGRRAVVVTAAQPAAGFAPPASASSGSGHPRSTSRAEEIIAAPSKSTRPGRVLIKSGPMSASVRKRPNCCAAAK